MKAVTVDKEVKLESDYPKPRRLSGEALVRVAKAGVCATDTQLIWGYMGFRGVLGHEFVGVVEECDDPKLKGKRVTGEINIGCGYCRLCREGLKNHCPIRTVLGIKSKDGAFAEYLTLPEANLHVVPAEIGDEEAVFIEPLAAAFEITEQLDILPTERVCVLGDGRLGLLVSQVIALTKCKLVTVGRHAEKLSILEEMGIKTYTEDTNEASDFDCVIDCTGNPAGIEKAMELTRPRGTVVLKTTVASREGLDLNKSVIDELTIVGSRCGPFEPAIEALKEGRIKVRPLISQSFPIEEAIDALEYATSRGVLKVLLDVS